MYSMVLFIVDTSFSGFLGSGEMPTSAVERIAATSASGIRPVKVTNSERSSRSTQRHEVVEAIARTDEGEADVAPTQLMDDVISHLQDEVHAVLWSHHAEVGGHMALVAVEGSGSAAVRRSLVRSGPVRTTVMLVGATPSRSSDDLPVRVVRGDHVVRGPCGAPLHESESPVDQSVSVWEPRFVQLWT